MVRKSPAISAREHKPCRLAYRRGNDHAYPGIRLFFGGSSSGKAVRAAWTAWDGESEITATDGHHVTVVEADVNGKAVRSGDVVADVFAGA